ncbi:MAB_1171c family putative transporter [Streptomyces sp. NPDC058611]|uniref:MAB_1171c family putative transporter n=1 Tax=unclassified Streptomyces TaxID=2593676 RepID=UPI00365C4955
MINILFSRTAVVLLAFAAYWVRGRGGHRPTDDRVLRGRALPALTWPVSQFLRRRWERRSFAALEPLWSEVTAVVAELVLDQGGAGADTRGQDVDFHLHRRVIEINDGVPALRGYRSPQVQAAAAEAVAGRGESDTPEGNAEVEAAVLTAAVAAKRAGEAPGTAEAPPAAGTHSRRGDLRAETEWLLLVTRACLRHRHRPRGTATAELSVSAAGSGS